MVIQHRNDPVPDGRFCCLKDKNQMFGQKNCKRMIRYDTIKSGHNCSVQPRSDMAEFMQR